MPAAAPLYATDASNYRQVPIGVVVPRDTDDVVAAVEVCRAHDVPIVSRGGGTSLAGQTCNVAVVLDHSKYHNQLLELDPEERWARVRPGLVLDELRDAAEAAPPHLRPGPGDPRPLHARRDDRQQLVRRPLGDGRQRPSTTSSSSRSSPTTGRACASAPTDDDERSLGSWPVAGARPSSTAAMRATRATSTPTEIRAPLPGHPAPRLRLQPPAAAAGARLRRRPGPRRLRVDAGHGPRGEGPAGPQPAGPDARRGRLSGRLRGRRRRPGGHGVRLHRLRGHRRQARPRRPAAGHPPGCAAAPARRSAASCWSSSAATTGPSPTSAPRRSSTALRRAPSGRRSPGCTTTRPTRRSSGRSANPGLGATAMVPDKPLTAPGWEDSAVPPERLGDYLRAIAQALGPLRLRRRHVRPLRPGRAPLPDRLRPRDRRRARRPSGATSTTPPDLVVGHGRLAVRRARRRPGPRRAAADHVRRRPRRARSRSSRTSGTRPGRMNPGKVVRPNPILADLRLGTDYAPPRPKTWFRFPEDDGSFAHAALPLRRRGRVPAPRRRRDVPELHGHPRGEALDPRPGPPAVRAAQRRASSRAAGATRRSRRRSTCASPARAARATARSTSTWRPTRRSSAPTTTPAACGPRAAYSMGLIHWWAGLAARAPRLANAAGARAAPRPGRQGDRRDRARSARSRGSPTGPSARGGLAPWRAADAEAAAGRDEAAGDGAGADAA